MQINARLSLTRGAERPYSLVVCEKPAAALRIAEALGTSGFKKISGIDKGWDKKRLLPPVFSATCKNGTRFVICSGIGHLYGLADPKGDRSVYPVFNIKWLPIIKKRNKRSQRTAATTHLAIIRTIAALSKNASGFIHACDYDQEGEVIGYNILQYACNNKYDVSLRAKFSTLTDEEIRNSFENLLKPSKGLAEAGRTRHMVDFIYGVNLSRALTQSFRASNNDHRYYTLSIGRVQGPTLAFVVDRETDIRKHIPVPYWTVAADFEKNGQIIKSHYYQQKVPTQSKAASIVEACTNQDGRVVEIKHQKIIVKAPNPFNLGDLQKEAYRVFKFSPSNTLTIAEKLYLNALISYPRTSSQKLPVSINYKKIISSLSKISSSRLYDDNTSTAGSHGPYTNLAMNLLSKAYLFPNEGNKTDPAHPAIYPTGGTPKGILDAAELQLFDLIVKRFLATFGEPAKSQHTTVTILVKPDHIFKSDDKKTTFEGWMYFYEPYVKRIGLETRTHLPELHTADRVKNIIVTMAEKFTQPPVRFNQANLLEEMEKENLGTKATRSDIISILFKRNYISNISSDHLNGENIGEGRGVGIEATDIGFEIVQSMRKYIPNIVSTDLTRSMEEQLEGIESGKARSPFVLEYAIDKLKEAVVSLKKSENEVGRQITDAITITRNKQQIILGRCPVCGNGDLKIVRSNRPKTRFVGCSNYKSGICKATAPLPQKGSIKGSGKSCSVCRWPIVITVYDRQAKNQWKFCLNLHCPSKKH
jgi:DNA topoisomerase-1